METTILGLGLRYGKFTANCYLLAGYITAARGANGFTSPAFRCAGVSDCAPAVFVQAAP